MSVNNKYQAICDTVKDRIARKVYTHRLPPRRELMEEFQVSSRTLHKVFMQLKIAGLIEPTPTGTVVCNSDKSAGAAKPKIVLITPVAPARHAGDPFIQSIIAHIEKYEFELDWSVCVKNNVLETLQHKSLSSRDSVIFTNSTFALEAGNYLKEKNITFVSANRPAKGVDINWVDWNHLELFDNVIGTLVNCGARYITFFGSGSPEHTNLCIPDNHWQILDDFEAVKKSYLLFYPKTGEHSADLYCDSEKYVDYLLSQKHLPDVIWCGNHKTKVNVDKILTRRGIAPGKIFLLCMSHYPAAEEDFFGVYTPQSLQKFGNKVWELLMFCRLHPEAPCRGIKQQCGFLCNKSIKKLKFNQS